MFKEKFKGFDLNTRPGALTVVFYVEVLRNCHAF